MTDGEAAPEVRRTITSEGLSRSAVCACWLFAVALLGAGITATFTVGGGAAAASMILLGTLLLIIGLMKRVPLSIEVAGAKFDASYPEDLAFEAGRESGRQEGVDAAISEVEAAGEHGETPTDALRRLQEVTSPDWRDAAGHASTPADGSVGYRGPTACNAAGITYRQLDYWARTGLVEPSVRLGGARLYSPEDIVLLRVIRKLLDAGVSLQPIRMAITRLRGIPMNRLRHCILLSDGDSVFQATTKDEVFDRLGAGDGLFAISLAPVVLAIESVLSPLPSEPTDDDPLPGLG